MKILAFIPARGGSKGIPRKNLALLDGKPLLQYAIEAAHACPLVDRIFLSSDSDETIAVGRALGVDSGYRRPPELSGDRARVIDALLHALDWLSARGEFYDAVVLLQPTSPLRSTEDISSALRLFAFSPGARTLVSVHRLREHPYECLYGGSGAWAWVAQPDAAAAGRQDYPDDYYFINGAIYVATTDFLRQEHRFVQEGESLLYVMPEARGLDIDEPEQLRLAEWLIKNRGESC